MPDFIAATVIKELNIKAADLCRFLEHRGLPVCELHSMTFTPLGTPNPAAAS
jgi:hypothetical protein